VANTLTAILPKILARAVLVLRELAVMPRLVNGDYSSEAAKKGATINVPIPTARAATDVVPGPTPPTPADTTPATVPIALDNWKKSNFFLTDKDLHEIDRNESFLPLEMGEAVRALANEVNSSIHAKYKRIYGFTGTAGSTPFASTVVDATNARKVLNQQLAPRANRRGVLDFAADANALALAPFSDAEKVMSAAVKIEGEIGRKFGIDWVADDQVVTHTRGALGAGALTINGVSRRRFDHHRRGFPAVRHHCRHHGCSRHQYQRADFSCPAGNDCRCGSNYFDRHPRGESGFPS
jgi:hypothetical protein